MERRHLRILYIPPGSSQYVLARSRSSVPISHFHHYNSNGNGSQNSSMASHFANVSLKTCVETIFESSPELFRDHNLDHSLYVLDPLESPTPVPSSSNLVGSSPPGVAVGMGLLSAIRRSGDQRKVTGTLMRDRTGLDALEVIFMLKETASMRKPTVEPVASTSTTKEHDAETSARIAAALARQQNEQKMMTERARKVALREGSPANQNLGHSGIASFLLKGKERAFEYKPFASAASSPAIPALQASSRSALPTPPSSQPALTPESTPAPNIEELLSALSHDSESQAQTLLAILSMVDTPGTHVDPRLVTALRENAAKRGLLPMPSHSTPQTPPQTPQPSIARIPPSPDDEVVVLDKENVNPTAFRRRAEREREEAKQIALGIGDSNNALAPSRPTQGLSQSARSNTTLSNNPVPPAPTPSTSRESGGRKRTLSDCLGSPKRDRGRTVRSVGKPESSSSRTSVLDPYRHYSTRVAISGDSWTSPPRFRRNNNENSSPGHGSSSRRPIVIPDSPSTPKVAASSPIRGTKTQVRRKPYVVPQWARTETATQPKLSEEAARAIQQRQQEQKEKKKLKQRKSTTIHRTNSGPAVFNSPIASTSKTTSQPCPPPQVAATSDPVSSTHMPMPIFALPANPISFPASSLSSSSRSRTPSPSPNSLSAPPCTPPRKRARSYHGSPSPGDVGDGSLFTPLAATPLGRGPVLVGSPLTSMSPTVSRQTRARGAASPSTSISQLGGTGNTDSDDELERELDGALSEIDCSSSTLPMASSDFGPLETTDGDGDVDSEDDSESDEEPETYPKKQFWQGLPPSSPPPPSSPMLSPQDRIPDSDRELPIASSDDDMNHPEEGESENHSDIGDPSEATDADVLFAHSDNNQQADEIDVYDMLTQLGAVPSMGYTDGLGYTDGMDMSFQNLNEATDTDWGSLATQIDLDEFVKAVAPILNGLPPGDSASGLGEGIPALGDEDLTKTSQNIQDLFSGCLV